MAVLLIVAGALLFKEFAPMFYRAEWTGRMQRGFEIWASNSDQGKSYIDKTLADARTANLPPAALMGLYRDYAGFLYGEDEKEKGDQAISSAIALCPVQPTTDSFEADALVHAYQDRAWDSHRRFLIDRSKPPGDKDQELSVSISEKAFGPEHEQTIYKIPSLALIYADLGYKDKAEKWIQRAIKTSDTVAGANECAWFSYALLSRIRAVQHDYKGATIAYSHAIEIAKDQDQRNRIWEEFSTGLRDGQPSSSKTSDLTKSLLVKDKFDELDHLGDQLVSTPSSTANGLWELDLMMNTLDGGRSSDESRYRQNVFDLTHWLSKNPHSAHARVALAQCHIYNAWQARYRETGDSMENSKQFYERIKKAREVLKADPGILQKTPVAYVAFARLAVADGDRLAYMKYLNECRTKWPTYYCLDDWGVRFALPHFFGKPGDAEKYIIARSNAISGKQGDEEYARLVWNNQDNLPPLFSPPSPIKWKRVQAGFRQIFNDFPHDMEARIAFIELTFVSNDSEALNSTFDGFQSSVPPIATAKP